MDIVGHAGGGPVPSASLLIEPSTGRTSVVLTNRLIPVIEAINIRMIRPID
jgi:hypothetical protein